LVPFGYGQSGGIAEESGTPANNSMSNSRISVCLPNYNHSRYLRGAIDALMRQSLPPHEIIVVDDASTDDSVPILEGLKREFPQVILLRNQTNQGCCRSTNRAIAAATGDYIFATAADDLVLPGYFEKSVAGLQKFPMAGVCVAQVKYIDDAGVEVPLTKQFYRLSADVGRKEKAASYLDPSDVIARLKKDPWFLHGGPSPLYRREVILAAGGLHDELGPYTDWFNVHYAALKHGMVYVPKPLVAMRLIAGGFGESSARSPLTAIDKLAQVLQLMRDSKFQDVFPPEFVRRKEVEFAYYAFAGSMNNSHRSLRAGIDLIAPPVSVIDQAMLQLLTRLHQVSKAVLLLYCRRKRNVIRWPDGDRPTTYNPKVVN
jgi:glycosyltransferase involved in cell wall biosynthesis